MKLEDEAKAFFGQHYNCAQSTVAPFAKRLGVDLDLILKIATPFGGGMGHAGQICGVVSGALMAIGLAKGITFYERDKKYACYALGQDFQEHFRALHGNLTCPGLLGLDIGNPEELTKVRELDLFHTLCPRFVGDAARITAEMLGLED
ncbi:MAG: C-GCAxxG-C-C family protein [Chloroflexota bacterium]|nr:C-GCAxxG-C-C family protein [Chloroflexota bacterium]